MNLPDPQSMASLHGAFMWQYRAIFTQTDVAGGHIVVDIGGNTGMDMLFVGGVSDADSYAASRNTEVAIMDSNYYIIKYLRAPVSLNNARLPLIFLDPATPASKMPNIGTALVSGGDIIRIRADSLAQNETLSIQLRAYLPHNMELPDVSTSKSTGTVTTSVAYNRVV